MTTHAAAAVLSLLLTGLAVQRPAVADGLPPATSSSIFSPAPSPRPTAAPAAPAPVVKHGDEGLGLEQFGLATAGAAVTVGIGLSLTLLTDDQESRAFGASFLVAPIAAGLVVCQVGRWSVLYRGRCGAAVAGAYVGAVGGTLAGLLLGYAGCSGASTTSSSSSDIGSSGSWDCAATILIGGGIGYVLGTATGALVGWNISKQPKTVAGPDATGTATGGVDNGDERSLAVTAPAPRLPASRSAGALPRQVVFPIFAAAF